MCVRRCAGYVGDMCAYHVDQTPQIVGGFDGDVCVASKSTRCDQLHVNADAFTVNPQFACKLVVRPPLTTVNNSNNNNDDHNNSSYNNNNNNNSNCMNYGHRRRKGPVVGGTPRRVRSTNV